MAFYSTLDSLVNVPGYHAGRTGWPSGQYLWLDATLGSVVIRLHRADGTEEVWKPTQDALLTTDWEAR